jgi:hypothetical protein
MPLRVGVVGALIGLLGSLIFAGPANATVSYTGILHNWAHGTCLDGNDAGGAYTNRCNGGNYQNWQIQFYASIDGFDTYRIVNQQTHRCLDGNGLDIYTNPCQDPNHYQKWKILYPHNGSNIHLEFQNVQTSRCPWAYDVSDAYHLDPLDCGDVGEELWRPGN